LVINFHGMEGWVGKASKPVVQGLVHSL